MASMPPDAQLKQIPWKEFSQRIARDKAIKKSQSLTWRAEIARANPEEAGREYAAARKSLFGNLGTNIDICQPCLVAEKAASRKARKDLTGKALASGCSACKEKAQRLRSDMDEVENMRCARQVYLTEDTYAPADLKRPPVGFRDPTPQELAEMGLTKDMLQPQGTNFRAQVYMKDPAIWSPPNPPDPKSVVAFRGSTPALEDWENNMMQGNDSDPGYLTAPGADTVNRAYYDRAVEIGKKVGKNSSSVQFVGHSLGGGLASAAQGGSGGASGNPASTYNSAGLHSKTVAKYSEKGAAAAADRINAIRVKGEVLTQTQEKSWMALKLPDAMGKKRDLDPTLTKAQYLEGQGRFDRRAAEQMGNKFDEDEEYSTSLHGMDQVIAAMEAQKQADQAALQDCAAHNHGLLHRWFGS